MKLDSFEEFAKYLRFQLELKPISNDVRNIVKVINDKSTFFAICHFNNKDGIDKVLSVAEYIPTLILANINKSNDFCFVYMLEGGIENELHYLGLLAQIFYSFNGIKPKSISPDIEKYIHNLSFDDWSSFPFIYKVVNYYSLSETVEFNNLVNLCDYMKGANFDGQK